MRHFGGQCQHVLFREVHILGDAALTRKPIDHQHGERGSRRMQGVNTSTFTNGLSKLLSKYTIAQPNNQKAEKVH